MVAGFGLGRPLARPVPWLAANVRKGPNKPIFLVNSMY
jgi:hypothetical protein